MFRFLFVLLLLNASYRGLGVPLPTTSTVSLESLLASLATNCENTFLSNHIKAQRDVCSGSLRPKSQLECLMFYDINTQLCSAVGASKLAIKEDYSAKINEEQGIQVLCDITKEWAFTNMTQFPDYIRSVKKIFSNPVTCEKMCGSDNLLSSDTTYVCKYYKWGAELLKQQVTIPPTKNVPPQQEIVITESKPASDEMKDVQIKNAVTSKVQNVPSELAQPKTDEAVKTEVVKPEASSENNQEPSSVAVDPENAGPKGVEEPIAENPPVASELTDNQLESEPKVSETENKPHSEIPEPSLSKPDLNPPNLDTVNKEEKPLTGEQKDPVEDAGQPKAKDPSDDDYQDSEDGKDGLGDIQGDDDSDDPNIDDLNKLSKLDEQKDKHQAPPSPVKSFSPDITSGDRIPGVYGAFPEDPYSDDDDDHFFSFFLTAIILVVVIYILYHNKNKVVKVFFGLILEGRQSGRRRNSRGHAYRRLDTLEQAMSTNSSAPPSKIIY